MRNAGIVALSVAVLAGTGFVTRLGAAPGLTAPLRDASKLDGTWTGTFTGDSSGKVTFKLNSAGEGGKAAGTLSVTMDEGESYEAAFKTLTLTDDSLSGSYDAPGDGGVVSLEAKLSGDALKGSWSAAGGGTGTWTATREAAQRP